LTYIEGHEVVTNEAMAVGTLFHAIQEYRIEVGMIPRREAVREMEGNYEPPRVAMDMFPHAWDEALEMARFVGIPDCEGADVEVPVEDFGLEIHGVPLTGFLDLDFPDQHKIDDWKTRSRLDYIPRTPGDFHDNPQLVYYATCVRQHRGWDTVTVGHRNVLRASKGGPKYVPIEVELEAWYLDRFWEDLHDVIVPTMLEIAETGNAPKEPDSCFKYGRCSYLGRQCSGGNDAGSIFDLNPEDMMDVLSPEAPENEQPVPYDEKPVDKLGINVTVQESMHNAGIHTLGDFEAWLESGGDVTELNGVGPTTAENIEAKREQLREGVKS
jgi:hypothetical protein